MVVSELAAKEGKTSFLKKSHLQHDTEGKRMFSFFKEFDLNPNNTHT